jgi:hypothetical protein
MKSKPDSFSLKFFSPIPLGGPPMNKESTTVPDVADIISRPSHYVGKGNLEAITVIRAFGLDESFELGSATKYLLRAGAKGSKIENIRKARQMLDMWLAEHDENKGE